MPLYEYKCEACGTITEVLEKSYQSNMVGHCPQCDKERTFTKLFSVFAAPAAKFKNVGVCGEPRGSCGGGGACGCGGH
jgi:putative FmdB family regulatory protein